MPTLPLHPSIVHLPLGLALVVPVVAAGAAMALWWGWNGRRLLGLLVALQSVVVVGGHLAARLGSHDARQVEAVLGPEQADLHEGRAETFLLAATVLLMGAVACWAGPPRIKLPVAALVAAGSLVVAVLAIRTGEAGGALSARYRAARVFHGPDGAPQASCLDGSRNTCG